MLIPAAELLVEALCLTGLMTGALTPLVFASCLGDPMSRSTFVVLLDAMRYVS